MNIYDWLMRLHYNKRLRERKGTYCSCLKKILTSAPFFSIRIMESVEKQVLNLNTKVLLTNMWEEPIDPLTYDIT